MYQGRNSDGRTDWLNQLDLFAQYELRLNERLRIAFNLNLINTLGSNAVINSWTTQLQPSTAINVTEDQFFNGVNTEQLIAAQGLQQDPRFLQSYGFQQPRQLRFGMRFSF